MTFFPAYSVIKCSISRQLQRSGHSLSALDMVDHHNYKRQTGKWFHAMIDSLLGHATVNDHQTNLKMGFLQLRLVPLK